MEGVGHSPHTRRDLAAISPRSRRDLAAISRGWCRAQTVRIRFFRTVHRIMDDSWGPPCASDLGQSRAHLGRISAASPPSAWLFLHGTASENSTAEERMPEEGREESMCSKQLAPPRKRPQRQRGDELQSQLHLGCISDGCAPGMNLAAVCSEIWR